VAITGANSGIGWHAALELARAGAEVILAARSAAKAEDAAARIRHEVADATLRAETVDLADLGSVRALGGRLGELPRLDLLINNAGVMNVPTRQLTKDGFELQFGTNFLGPFALTVRLLPLLLAAPNPRVATMSSGTASYGRIHFDDLQAQRRYRPNLSYAQSKLADLLLAQYLADRVRQRGWNLVSTAAHPGFTRTNLQTAGASLGREKPKRTLLNGLSILPSRDVEHGTEPLLYAATSPDAITGGYDGPGGRFGLLLGPTTTARIPRRARDAATATRLWAETERLTGVTLPIRVG
jgi:NAD(P)-dependent dehydrogenase (short-subunit alcohol dehydrogenase family)